MQFSKKDIETLVLQQVEGYNTNVPLMFAAVGGKHAIGDVEAGFLLLVKDGEGFTVDGTVIGASGANDYADVLRNRTPITVPHRAVQNFEVGDYPHSPNITGQLMTNIMLVHSVLRSAYEMAKPHIDDAQRNAEREVARAKAQRLLANMNLPAPAMAAETKPEPARAAPLKQEKPPAQQGVSIFGNDQPKAFYVRKAGHHDLEGALVSLFYKKTHFAPDGAPFISVLYAPEGHPLAAVQNMGKDWNATQVSFRLLYIEDERFNSDKVPEKFRADTALIRSYLRARGLELELIKTPEQMAAEYAADEAERVAVEQSATASESAAVVGEAPEGATLPNVSEVAADSGKESGATSPASSQPVEVPVVDIAGAEAAMIKPPKAVRGARRRDTALDALVTDGSTGTGRRHPASKQQENRAHA